MISETRLSGLLFRWRTQQAFGRDVPAAELCPDSPELAADLARRIAVIRQVQALADELQRTSLPRTITGSCER